MSTSIEKQVRTLFFKELKRQLRLNFGIRITSHWYEMEIQISTASAIFLFDYDFSTDIFTIKLGSEIIYKSDIYQPDGITDMILALDRISNHK